MAEQMMAEVDFVMLRDDVRFIKPKHAHYRNRTISVVKIPCPQSSSRSSEEPENSGLEIGAGREKTLASAGHVSILHPQIQGVIN